MLCEIATSTLTQFNDYLVSRDVFGQAMIEVAGADKNVILLTADLMRSTGIIGFQKVFPERFFNVGVAEQNLIGVSTGLAMIGYTPFATTFAAFASMRACEQIRTDVCYQNVNVKIVGTHCGLSSGGGATHNATEDLAIMRGMPNMTVIAPGDPRMIKDAVHQMAEMQGPAYLRIGRGLEPVIYGPNVKFKIGKSILAKPGCDISIIACGSGVKYALQAAYKLIPMGISAQVLEIHTLKPIDTEAILAAAEITGKIITVEDHNIIGGLGSAVAETLLESGIPAKLKRLGLPDEFAILGGVEDLHHYYGIDTEGVFNCVLDMLNKGPHQ